MPSARRCSNPSAAIVHARLRSCVLKRSLGCHLPTYRCMRAIGGWRPIRGAALRVRQGLLLQVPQGAAHTHNLQDVRGRGEGWAGEEGRGAGVPRPATAAAAGAGWPLGGERGLAGLRTGCLATVLHAGVPPRPCALSRGRCSSHARLPACPPARAPPVPLLSPLQVGHVGREDQRGQRDAQLVHGQHQALPEVHQARREERRLQPGHVQVRPGEAGRRGSWRGRGKGKGEGKVPSPLW